MGKIRQKTQSLSSKLLLLTILFVMLAEVFIFVPSVANYRKSFLLNRLETSQFVPLAARAAPDGMLPKEIKMSLLEKAQVYSVAVKKANNVSISALRMAKPVTVDQKVDLDKDSSLKLILDAFYVFIAPNDRILSVRGKVDMMGNETMEIVIAEKPLKTALYAYARNIFILSLLISVLTAILIYIAINRMLVRPITRLTDQIVHFSADPEDESRIIKPQNREDELGLAEQKLSKMQTDLQSMFKQKNRLAELGLAVSKINHDLRNMLANAQLISDNLGTIENPSVQRLTPRLINSLDRAIRLCSDTLKYGKNPEAQIEKRRFPLRPLIDEVFESSEIQSQQNIIQRNEIDSDLELNADRDQMFRALSNLVRNANQAILAERKGNDEPGRTDKISISGVKSADGLLLHIRDTGPGIPENLRDDLFKPFNDTGNKAGTGLGLAISAEIIKAHKGTISLEPSDKGSVFKIVLSG